MTHSSHVKQRLKWALLFTALILLVELIGGIISNSLALIGDAAHMFSDMAALGLSWLALTWAHRPSPNDKTYGYHRAEILAALINGILLFTMAGMIAMSAWERLDAPREIDSVMVMIVAAIGLVTNGIVIFILKDSHHHSHDLNVKSAFYHVIGDTISSAGVIVGGAVIWYTGWYYIDSLIALAIACLLVWGAKNILSDSVHILMEGAPKNASVTDVVQELKLLPGILDIHELHIWSICSNVNALSAHVLIPDQKVNQAETILTDIQSALADKFNITHSTIQFESALCNTPDLSCEIEH
jgi:cobalt-zinc-cadmium efflux system protein